jgi:uncharacterized membrane protein
VFISYVLSFIYVGIYWNNHHHMLHAVRVTGGDPVGQPAPAVLAVADPVRDGWMGENHNLAGIGLAFVNAWVAVACYVAVAVIWFLPDRRIERVLNVT